MKKFICLIISLISVHAVFSQQKIVVSKDGSGNYKTVQEALNMVPLNNKKSIIIFVKNGLYQEKLRLDSNKNHVTLIGEDRFQTILTFDDHTGKTSAAGKNIDTRSSYSFLVLADNFKAENITFRNDAGFTAGQAVALEVRGDKAIFTNCRIIGNQDILFLNSEKSRQYYQNCYIEGTTDFIFGSATVWFEQCHIHSKKNSHITAASTPQNHPFGFVFDNCVLTGDSLIHSASLGRPWRPYANVIYMHCYIGQQIRAEGWSKWNNQENFQLARFAEYQNYGPNANPAARVSWSKQLTDEEAKKTTIKTVLGNWNPKAD